MQLPEPELVFKVIENPQDYDLSEYCAQVVKNEEPWSFDQQLVKANRHAQHKLRIVTYNYGDRYLPDYVMQNSGIFIERHQFIQSITPMNEMCGGYVLLGKESGSILELVAVTIPYGCTLLVNVNSIHGDSTLTGLHMMAMTGNHIAMSTADTVFLKTASTGKNVSVTPSSSLEAVKGMSADCFLLTSDEKSLDVLRDQVDFLKTAIKSAYTGLDRLILSPVILTLRRWSKTLGLNLY